MKENGVVIKLNNRFATIRIGRNSACCACGKCGMNDKQKHVDFLVENSLGAAVGDTVSVEIPDGNTATLALVAYIVPIVPALALMFAAFAFDFPVWGTLLMFFGGLATGFASVVVVDKIRKHRWMQSPAMVEIVQKSSLEQINL